MQPSRGREFAERKGAVLGGRLQIFEASSMASEQETESPRTAPAAPAAAGAAPAASAEPAEPAEPSDLIKAYMWSPPMLVACFSVLRGLP